ncbi:MAG: FxsA family protein [Pseudomonadota bacterium]
MWFILIFIALPLIEIVAFVEVGGAIGTPKTLILCFITAVLGGYFVKKQGLETLAKAQKHMTQGQMPVQQMFDGLCLIATGAMMITPGFVTDTIGFLLLIPAVRVLLRQFLAKTAKFSVHSTSFQEQRSSNQYKNTSNDVIEGEYTSVDTDKNNN